MMNRRLLSLLCTTACAQQVFVSVGISVRGHGPVVFVVDAHEKISVLPVHLARSMCERATLDDITGWDTVRVDYDPDGAILALPYGSGSYFTVFFTALIAITQLR